MANIEKRTTQDGKTTFRVKVRLRGFPAQSATFCIERLIPKLRKESIGVELDDDDLKIKKDILQAILDGRLEVEKAEKLLNLIKTQTNQTSYKIDTIDPIEASKIYQRIMMEK